MNILNSLKTLNKKYYIFGGLLFIALVGLPLLTYFSQRPQETRSRAAASTTLHMSPNSTSATPIAKQVGDTVSLDVYINPGTNLPSVVKLDIIYDQAVLQPAAVPFAVNTTAFPTTIEGPVILNGHVYISVSIGSDSTKAIQTTTKIGTVNFTALNATTAPTLISFGPKAQVLSIASTDEATQNVLATTAPAYLTIANLTYISPTIALAPTLTPYPPTPTVTTAPTTTPIPTPTPTEYPVGGAPTGVPTPTPSPTPSTAPPTPIPTVTVLPTPTHTPNATTIALQVLIHGIGNSGDNSNPTASTLSNKNPIHPARTLEVTIFDNQNTLIKSAVGTVIYSSTSGSFVGTIDLGNTITEGFYTVKIKEPTHLRRLLPGILTLRPETNNVAPEIAIIAGDINNDNFINVLDYNLLIGCYSDLLPPVSCNDTTKITTDLNDDGHVNQHDYNFFLREVSVQLGG